MGAQRPPFWGWPGIGNLAYAYLVLGPLLLFTFVFVYGGADYVARLHSYRTPLYLDWELMIPFVPATVLFYNSLHVAYSLTPFILRTRPEMNATAMVWITMTFVAGIAFLALPFKEGYPPPTDAELGVWRPLYQFADDINLQYNCFPSLHIAWSVACLDVFAAKAGLIGKVLLWAWGAGIMLSTLLLHQHHVIDVVGGLALALAGSRWLYPALYARFARHLR